MLLDILFRICSDRIRAFVTYEQSSNMQGHRFVLFGVMKGNSRETSTSDHPQYWCSIHFVKVDELLGRNAIVRIFDNAMTNKLLEAPNITIFGITGVIIRYPHIDFCANCISPLCRLGASCTKILCAKCGSESHTTVNCTEAQACCFRCSSGSHPNPLIRKYQTHRADDKRCTVLLKTLRFRPNSLYGESAGDEQLASEPVWTEKESPSTSSMGSSVESGSDTAADAAAAETQRRNRVTTQLT